MRPDSVPDRDPFEVRLATPGDVAGLEELIPHSVRALSRSVYSAEQIESAIRYVFGVDSQLIADGTYFVVTSGDRTAGCGGWSRRRTLFGADKMKEGTDPLLDPATEPARIRAFFIHPDFARRGVGARLLGHCVAEAGRAGFRALELMATLPGVPLYTRFGFTVQEPVTPVLPDGVLLPMVRMGRKLEAAAAG
jgi:GNAT superfamily N-acetyltransferase